MRVGKMKRGGGITQPNLTRAIILFNLCVTGTFFLLEPAQDATLFLGFLLLFLHLLELFYLLFSCFFVAFIFTFLKKNKHFLCFFFLPCQLFECFVTFLCLLCTISVFIPIASIISFRCGFWTSNDSVFAISASIFAEKTMLNFIFCVLFYFFLLFQCFPDFEELRFCIPFFSCGTHFSPLLHFSVMLKNIM